MTQETETQGTTIGTIIGRACIAIVLCQLGVGALAGTGKLPGHLEFAYELTNRSADDLDSDQQTKQAKKLTELQDEAAKHTATKVADNHPPVPGRNPIYGTK